jgi:DNA-binding CsgD family transcriptional regulator
MTEIGLTDIVAQAFEAACDPDGLDTWIKNLANFFGVSGAALVIWPNSQSHELKVFAYGVSPDHLREQFERRHEADTIFNHVSTLRTGETCIVEAADDAASLAPDDRPSRTTRPAIAGVVLVDDIHRCFLTLFRDAGNNTFSQSEIDALRTLTDYFRRAVVLNRRFIDLTSKNKTLLSVLDNAPRGIVSLGQNGQATYINTEAQRIFLQTDGLSLTGDVINFRDEQVGINFSNFIELARRGDASSTEPPTMINFIVERNMTAMPYQIRATVVPFDKGQAVLNPDETLAFLIIQDPTSHLKLRPELLKTFYNLSAAEARLAMVLWEDHSLPDAAALLHVSINTARSQLRGIFKKMGVASQAGLLKELAAGLKDATQTPGTRKT